MSRRYGRSVGRWFWGIVLRILIKLLLRLEVRGEEHLPMEGGGIVYYNHIHWLDPPVICGSMRRLAVPLAKVEVGRFPFVSWILRHYGVIYIRRGAVDRQALQATWDALRRKRVVVISPEGTRSEDGRLLEAKEGLMFIAKRNPEAWFMPCAIVGTPAFRPSLPHLFHRPRVLITYGPPFRVAWPSGEDAARIDRRVLGEMTDAAMVQLAALLPEEMRGRYAREDDDSLRWLAFNL